MNKSETRKYFKDAKKNMHLDHWEIELIFEDKDESEEGWIGVAYPDYVYMKGSVVIYKLGFEEDMKLLIRHELAHFITQPLYMYCRDLLNGKLRTLRDIEDQREKITEWIARIV